MIAVAVIVSLGAALVPSLHAARMSGRRIATTHLLRTHMQVFGVYANDYRESWPYFHNRHQLMTTITLPGGETLSYPYFWWYDRWNYALGPLYYEGIYDSSFYPPYPPYTSEALRYGGTPLVYSCSFLADPAYWNPSSRVGPSQWRATRQLEVQFPTRKFVIANQSELPVGQVDVAEILKGQYEFALADGSAGVTTIMKVMEGYINGDGPYTEPIHSGDPVRGLHTIDGVRGRDLP